MSHTIILSYKDKELYYGTCNSLENKLNIISDNFDVSIDTKTFAIYLKNEIKIIKDKINLSSKMSDQEYINFLSKLSSIEKQVANIFQIASDDKLNNLIKSVTNNKLNVNMCISQHGLLAIEVFNYLEQHDIEVNEKSFNKYLKEINDKNINDTNIKEYISKSINKVNRTQLPNEIKISLINDIRSKKDINLIKDVFAIVESKENEFHRMVEFQKKLSLELSKQDFKVTKKNVYEYDSKENVIIWKFNMINKNNNVVQIKIDSNNNLSYKLGNYIGHACEKTTEKLLNDLKNKGISIEIKNIKRDYEYSDKYMLANINKKNK